MGNMGNMNNGTKKAPDPMAKETDPQKNSKDSKVRQIRQTRFVIQFIWQPVPKEERDVNDIIWQKVTAPTDPPKPLPNLDVPLSEIETEVAKANELITAENEKNKALPEGDTERHLKKELLKVTQEQYDKFKTRFLTKGTPEQLPSAIKATLQPAAGDMGSM
jgi:hypothetical protein